MMGSAAWAAPECEAIAATAPARSSRRALTGPRLPGSARSHNRNRAALSLADAELTRVRPGAAALAVTGPVPSSGPDLIAAGWQLAADLEPPARGSARTQVLAPVTARAATQSAVSSQVAAAVVPMYVAGYGDPHRAHSMSAASVPRSPPRHDPAPRAAHGGDSRVRPDAVGTRVGQRLASGAVDPREARP